MPIAGESTAFRYPPAPHVRRHGPRGYADYHSYRPWLRDEFTFRCVYCLIRERWGRVTGEFDLEHFIPQIRTVDAEAAYENLLYACHTCNLRKARRDVLDPSIVLTTETVRVYPDGAMIGMTSDAERLIRVLCLNSPQMIRWRRTWIRIVDLAREHDADHYRQLMGYPDDLPDLSRCAAPANTKPQGIQESWFAHGQRGELGEVYLS